MVNTTTCHHTWQFICGREQHRKGVIHITGKEFVEKCKADVCLTQSRSRNGKKYHNKYTELLGKLGYSGINKNGVFTKRYSYGVVGHCCIGVQYWLIKCGLEAFVPKKGYIWNTNNYAKWLKSKPLIGGYGKVGWSTDIRKAKTGDIIFKGSKKEKSYSHTCVFIKYEKGYVYTVDFNVTGKKNGKKYNNGLVFKRKATSYRWGVAHMPYPVKYTVNTKSSPLNIRKSPSTTGEILCTLKKGTAIYVTSIVNNWANVVSPVTGFCSAKYIKKFS